MPVRSSRKLAGDTKARRAPRRLPGRWPLQDAKARFSELVRKACEEGPQHITVHGRDTVVVLSQEKFLALTGAGSGELLVALMASSPLREVEIDHGKIHGPVRDVSL
jgi:prevent-host-death family protein